MQRINSETITGETGQKRKQNSSHLRVYIRRMDEDLRRLLDIVLSLLGILVLSPLFLLIAIAIKRTSPGPIFYWGPRAGKDGKVFKIMKFRTMYERQESYQGPKVTAENDPRITPLGRMLRQTKLNELPQLWNVLRGDMSLVGPRPEDPSIAMQWPEAVRNEILSVRPGITSPASVVYRNEEELLQSSNLMDTYLWDILPTKLRLDQLYVRKRSVLSDLDIVMWTLVALLPRLKTYAVPEHLLYWGPLSRFTHRILSWFLVDWVVAFISIAISGVVRRMSAPLDLGITLAVPIALLMAFLFSLINSLAGINRINWSTARAQDAFDLAISTGIVTGLIFVANLLFPDGPLLPPSVVVMSGIFAFIGFILARYRSRLFVGMASRWIARPGSGTIGERVLIVGAGEVGRFAAWLLRNETLSQAFSIIGMVDDDPRKIGSTIGGCTVLTTTGNIPELVKLHDIGLILFAISDIEPTEQERILALCQSTPARIVPIPDILETLKAQFPRSKSEQNELENKLILNATVDRLTGASNRQHFIQLAEIELARARRYQRPLSLIMLAVDYRRPAHSLQSYTTLTHILRQAARDCLENIRGIDILGRYQDNILVILLPETDQAAAQIVSDRIRRSVSSQEVPTNRGSVQPVVTASIITSDDPEEQGIQELLSEVYKKLDLLPMMDLKEPKIIDNTRRPTGEKTKNKVK